MKAEASFRLARREACGSSGQDLVGGDVALRAETLLEGRRYTQSRDPAPVLRLHGLVERLPGTHRYQVTRRGLRIALFFTRVHARLLRSGLALVLPDLARDDQRLRRAFDHLERAMDRWCAEAKLAA